MGKQVLPDMDDEIKRLRRDQPMVERLHTIPGIGLSGALFLVAEIGTIDRFSSAHQLAAYAGLVPSTGEAQPWEVVRALWSSRGLVDAGPVGATGAAVHGRSLLPAP